MDLHLFSSTETLLLTHMGLLLSLEGFFILGSVSQRASLTRWLFEYYQWVMMKKAAVGCEWKPWHQLSPKLLVFGRKKIKGEKIRLWKTHWFVANSVEFFMLNKTRVWGSEMLTWTCQDFFLSLSTSIPISPPCYLGLLGIYLKLEMLSSFNYIFSFNRTLQSFSHLSKFWLTSTCPFFISV